MKNFIQPGNVLTLTAPADVSSGDVVVVGDIIGVAAYDAASGSEVEVSVVGVYELPKAAEALTQGAGLFWNGTGVTAAEDDGGTPATAYSFVGHAIEAAAEAAATVRVRLSL